MIGCILAGSTIIMEGVINKMTKIKEGIVYVTISLRSGETLQCDDCDELIRGGIAYLYAPDGREVEDILCWKCKSER